MNSLGNGREDSRCRSLSVAVGVAWARFVFDLTLVVFMVCHPQQNATKLADIVQISQRKDGEMHRH